MTDTKKTEAFGTEVSELLQLIIHSLYSHPEIFIRELISNSSDALDKLKIESLTNAALLPEGYEPQVRITPDKEARTLTISDNGIGMTLDEVRENIGTIAHSGTKAFIAASKELKERPELIGQFGVGFYSAFIVADKVTVETQKAGESEGTRWESDGKGTFTTEPVTRPEGTGTTITLHLKPAGEEEGDLEDYTDEWVIKRTIKKHSDFIAYPIVMAVSKQKPVGEAKEGEEQQYEDVIEDETLNSQKALWLRSPSEVSDEEYNEFYKQISRDFTDPLKTVHYRAEGTVEFSALLYVPGMKPWNYDYENSEKGLNLYVKRVLIMSDCEDLLPLHLRFMKGVIDSSDLSLNVSRELLQRNRQIVTIRKAVTTRIYKMLGELMKEDREKYEQFWKNFGVTLKEGIVREPDSKEKVLPLGLFRTTAGEGLVTLEEYVERMKDGQESIYYIFGASHEALTNSPHLEKLREKEYEVILFSDPIDEFIIPQLDKFEERTFVSITDAELDLDSEVEKAEKEEVLKEAKRKFEPVMDVIRARLQEDIKEVRLSKRLKDSPVCLVEDGQVPSAQLEALYRQMGQELPKVKRILEINPEHPVFDKMLGLEKPVQENWADILYGQALLSEGAALPDPAGFSKKIATLMAAG